MPRRTFVAGHSRRWRAVSACPGRRALAALFVGLALVMVACGGSRTGAAPTPTARPATSPTATPQPSCVRWRIVAIPDGTRYLDSRLLAVSGVSPTDAWAVGINFTEGGTVGPLTSLIERWDGAAWHLLSSPGSGSLNGVAAISANDAWAVGSALSTQQTSLRETLVEHWNGATWSLVASPDPGATNNILNGVAALASNDVWAVGAYNTTDALVPLIEHWDGTAWHVVQSAVPQGVQSELFAVARIPGANQLWAVGSTLKLPRPSFEQPLIERWNGTAWQIVAGPTLPSGALGGQLKGVAALSAMDAWAVGEYTASNHTRQPLMAHWNGSAWASMAGSLPSGAEAGFLSGVAAAGSRDVRAVGGSFTGGAGMSQAMIAQWDGAAWRVIESPAPSGASYRALNAVTTDGAGNYWAVGSYSAVAGREQTLAVHCP